MGKLYDMLKKDVRYHESLKACINCGTCSAICPAASFYKYDPLEIIETVQCQDENQLEELLKSDKIWYCGECLSCATRCPRGNTVGLLIMALRKLSQETGLFVESEKGRQQLALKRAIGDNIVRTGYCVYIDTVKPERHPEAGPVWEWIYENRQEVMKRVGANYKGTGTGPLRDIPQETLDEIKKIFDLSGGTELFENIEKFSAQKAAEMGLRFDETTECEYFNEIFTKTKKEHTL